MSRKYKNYLHIGVLCMLMLSIVFTLTNLVNPNMTKVDWWQQIGTILFFAVAAWMGRERVIWTPKVTPFTPVQMEALRNIAQIVTQPQFKQVTHLPVMGMINVGDGLTGHPLNAGTAQIKKGEGEIDWMDKYLADKTRELGLSPEVLANPSEPFFSIAASMAEPPNMYVREPKHYKAVIKPGDQIHTTADGSKGVIVHGEYAELATKISPETTKAEMVMTDESIVQRCRTLPIPPELLKDSHSETIPTLDDVVIVSKNPAGNLIAESPQEFQARNGKDLEES